MFTINLSETVIREIFDLHINPDPDLSDETIATIDAIDNQYGLNWMPTDVVDGVVTFEII